MSNESKEVQQKPLGKGPFFYAGLMFSAYGIVAGLAITDAIEEPAIRMLLMFVPMGLLFPMMNAANRRIDDGGDACSQKGAAQKRYNKRVMIFILLYLVTMAIFVRIEDSSNNVPEALRIVLAILLSLPMIGLFWAIGRVLVEEQDEFLRMLLVRQSLIATGITLSAASLWGFLEAADIVFHLDAYSWPIIWFSSLIIGSAMNWIKYGTWGGGV